MDEGLAKLIIGLMIAIAIVYVVVWVIIIAVVVAAILAPPVGAGYWLRNLIRQRYQLGPRRIMKCVLVGLAMAALPWFLFVVRPSPTSGWAAAATFWMSVMGGLLGVGLYISLSVYREFFWPHRKIIIAATKRSIRLRQQLWLHDFQLSRVTAKVRKAEQQEGVRLMEIRQLEESVSEIVRSTDPAFLSAERIRWELEYCNLAEAALRQKLEDIQNEISHTDQTSPYLTSLVVHAGVIRLNAQKRAVEAGAGATYEADTAARENLQSIAGEFRQQLNTIQQEASGAYASLRQLRRQRLFVQ